MRKSQDTTKGHKNKKQLQKNELDIIKNIKTNEKQEDEK